MNGGTYKILLVFLAVGGIVGGAWALDARIETKIERAIKPHLEYIKVELAEIKAELRK